MKWSQVGPVGKKAEKGRYDNHIQNKHVFMGSPSVVLIMTEVLKYVYQRYKEATFWDGVGSPGASLSKELRNEVR
jgi:hypothetical protein